MTQHDEYTDIEDLLGVYALDAIDAPERDLVEQHLQVCEVCRAEVDEHHTVLATLSADMEPAPDRIWARIAGTLDAQQPRFANVIPLTGSPRNTGQKPFRWVAGVAAAMVVLLGGAVFSQANQIDDLNTRVAAQEQEITTLASAQAGNPLEQAVTVALDDPGAQVATLTAEGTAGAMLIVVLPDGTGYVYQSTLEQLPDDLTYQLWAVIDDRVISAGVLGNRPTIVPFHIDPEGLKGLVITREVSGGVAQSEADPVVSWFGA
ncbi:MAG: anti-sigma factor [Acidimicrobiia bacterium]|nr:anti-sigma factor [Acidimicrobiia bacterium]